MKMIFACAFALSLTATVAGAAAVVDATVPTAGVDASLATGVFTTTAGLTFGFIGGILVLLSGSSSSSSTTH